jgi:hypothetical protein
MANPNAAFGLLPIGKVGQNRDAQGLSEYGIAASSSAIYQNDPVTAAGHWIHYGSYKCFSIIRFT